MWKVPTGKSDIIKYEVYNESYKYDNGTRFVGFGQKNKGRKENHIVKQNMQEKGINKKLSTHSDKTQTQCQIIWFLHRTPELP